MDKRIEKKTTSPAEPLFPTGMECARAALTGIIAINENGAIEMADDGAAQILGFKTGGELTGLRQHQFFGQPGKSNRRNEISGQQNQDGMIAATITRADGTKAVIHVKTIHAATAGGEKKTCIFLQSSANIGSNSGEIGTAGNMLRAVAKSERNAIVAIGAQRNICMWNKSAEKLFGFSEQETIGKDISEFLRPAKNPHKHNMAIDNILNSGMKNEDGKRLDFDMQDRSGRVFPATVEYATYMTPGGHGAMFIIADNSAYRQAIEFCVESEGLFTGLLENSPAQIFVKETGGGKYLLINQAMRDRFGDIDGLETHEIFPEPLAKRFNENERLVVENGKPMQHESIIAEPDGPHKYLTTMFPLRDATGKIYAIGGISTDITDKIRMEQQLHALSGKIIQSQEEERARVAVELHDELGQQLTALRWVLDEISESGCGDGILQKIDGCLNIVAEAKEDLRRICRGLRPPLLDELGMSAAVKSLIEEFIALGFYKIESAAPPEELDSLPSGTSLSLYRILQESLTNAAKHARATKVKIEFLSGNGYIEMRVRDNGKGFARAALGGKKCFGIAGMKERAALCGASLEIFSDIDRGTEIITRLTVR